MDGNTGPREMRQQQGSREAVDRSVSEGDTDSEGGEAVGSKQESGFGNGCLWQGHGETGEAGQQRQGAESPNNCGQSRVNHFGNDCGFEAKTPALMPESAFRDQFGRFRPGQSGNPAGRPVILADVVAAARRHSIDAVEVLAEIMNDLDVHPVARARAAVEISKTAFGSVRSISGGAGEGAAGDITKLSDAELVAIVARGRGA